MYTPEGIRIIFIRENILLFRSKIGWFALPFGPFCVLYVATIHYLCASQIRVMLKLVLLAAVVASFFSVDRDFRYKCNYRENNDTLLVMLESAFPGSEKAEVYWRLSRVSLMMGEQEQTKSAKRAHYAKGMEYAENGIKEDAGSKECYMWHCANIGRECQTRNIMEQASSVPKMMKDLTMILDKLGKVDYSEAWQALSELYYHHPLKSDDAAISFARKAATCIPSDELRISTYTYLAEILYKRNNSAGKRASEAAENIPAFRNTNSSNIEKYSYFNGTQEYMPWSIKSYSSLSDREEAAAILSYARGVYTSCSNPTPLDKADYKKLVEFTEKIGK